MTTVRDVIEQARIRHWAFTDTELGDGAALLDLNSRQQRVLLKYRDSLKNLLTTSIEEAAVVAGLLVGVDTNGNPIYQTNSQDGWAVHVDANGFPYVDTTEPKIAGDPFGQNGGTPGWPLPASYVCLSVLTATFQDGSTSPIDVVGENVRFAGPPTRYPTVFISGSRLVPLRSTVPSGSPDIWNSVSTVTLSYVPLPVLVALTDATVLPAACLEPLVAGMAALFATQSRKISQPERLMFQKEAKVAEEAVAMIAFDLLGELQSETVTYEGEASG